MSPSPLLLHAWTGAAMGLAVGITIASVILSVGATMAVVVRLPSDYFVREKRPLPFEGRSRWLRIGARVGMNLLGALLIVVGVLLSFPGVPGQGLLTILLGVMLVDVPGKRRVERFILRRKLVARAVNRLRSRFHRPPLDIPGHTPGSATSSSPDRRELSSSAPASRGSDARSR